MAVTAGAVFASRALIAPLQAAFGSRQATRGARIAASLMGRFSSMSLGSIHAVVGALSDGIADARRYNQSSNPAYTIGTGGYRSDTRRIELTYLRGAGLATAPPPTEYRYVVQLSRPSAVPGAPADLLQDIVISSRPLSMLEIEQAALSNYATMMANPLTTTDPAKRSLIATYDRMLYAGVGYKI